jgi:hypothetical protein
LTSTLPPNFAAAPEAKSSGWSEEPAGSQVEDEPGFAVIDPEALAAALAMLGPSAPAVAGPSTSAQPLPCQAKRRREAKSVPFAEPVSPSTPVFPAMPAALPEASPAHLASGDLVPPASFAVRDAVLEFTGAADHPSQAVHLATAAPDETILAAAITQARATVPKRSVPPPVAREAETPAPPIPSFLLPPAPKGPPARIIRMHSLPIEEASANEPRFDPLQFIRTAETIERVRD